MKISLFKSSVLLILLCASFGAARTGFKLYRPGARTLGYGRSGVVEIYDASALYWNPASLGVIKDQLSFFSFHPTFLLDYFGYAKYMPFYGTFAAHLARSDFIEEALSLGGLGWGTGLGHHLYAGFGINWIKYAQEASTAAGFGLLFRPTFQGTRFYDDIWQSPLIADRLAIGLSLQNIALNKALYSKQWRFGLSYSLSSFGPKFIYAAHFNDDYQTKHFGFSVSPLHELEIFAGIENFDSERLALGMQVVLDNLDLACVYDLATEGIRVSTSFRIGPSIPELSIKAQEKARDVLLIGNARRALKLSQLAHFYNSDNKEALQMINKLEAKVIQEKKTIDTLLNSAKVYINKKWYISAAVNYMKVLRVEPGNGRAQMAIKSIQPYVDEHTDRWHDLSSQYFTQGEFMLAKDLLETILLVRPSHANSRELLQKVNDMLHNEAENHYYVGLGYYNQKILGQAEEAFKKALELVPDFEPAREYLEQITRDRNYHIQRVVDLLTEARSLEERRLYVRASSKYSQVLELDPENSFARNKYVELQKYVGRYINQQLSNVERAFNRGDFDTAQRLIREILSIRPDHSGAQRYLRRINATTSDKSQRYLTLGKQYLAQGMWDMAISAFDSVMAVNPSSRTARQLRSNALEALNAEKLLEQAKVAYLQGDYQNAVEIYNQILANNPSHSEAKEMRDYCQLKLDERVDEIFNQGIKYYIEEKYLAAILEWDRALQINPAHKGSLEYKRRAKERLDALKMLR